MAAPAAQVVQVAAPFLSWHYGPGEGYPVFHVSEQGERISLHSIRHDWVRVSDDSGHEGWISLVDIQSSVDEAGRPVNFKEIRFDDYRTRRWEAGVGIGDFAGAGVTSASVGYWWSDYLSTEFGVAQVLGDYSEILLAHGNLIHQPFPAWKVSPYVLLGAGLARINPKNTLANVESRGEDTLHVGLGARIYLTQRYLLRLEYRDYVVFTDRDQNEEAQEWKAGLSVFF